MFREDLLTHTTQSICWTAIFFIGSSAASSAHLTLGEVFPLEIRGLAIAIFYAAGTLVGGVSVSIVRPPAILEECRAMRTSWRRLSPI